MAHHAIASSFLKVILMLKTQQTYLDYLESVGKTLEGTYIDRENLDSLASEITQTELLVPFIGNFSAGKSSLLNAFLGQDLLAVGLTPETELATELRYGDDPHVLAFREDGDSERLDIANLNELKRRPGEFTHLRVYLDHPRLKALPSLVLVDMPGFGSALTSHNQAISYYLPRGAHFIVVTSVEDGNVVQSLMRQLEELRTYHRSFTFVLNKTNLRSDDDVKAVASTVAAQISIAFPGSSAPICIGHDGSEQLQEIFSRIDPEQVFRRAFEPRLRDFTHNLIGQINLAVASLKRGRAENDEAREELTEALHRIERKRDAMIADLADQRMDSMVERCVRETGRALERSADELAEAGASGNQEGFSRIITDVIRGAMTRTIKTEMEGIGQSAIVAMNDALSELTRNIGNVDGNPAWLNDLTERVGRAITQTQDSIGRASDIFSRHAGDMQKNPVRTGLPDIKTTYRGIATILAVTTSLAAPIVELIIIFLPDILNALLKGRQRDALRNKLINELIPSIQSKLREELGQVLREHINAMVAEISGQFEHEIAEKRQVIETMTSTHDEQGEQSQAAMELLTVARQSIERLAGETLYKKGGTA